MAVTAMQIGDSRSHRGDIMEQLYSSDMDKCLEAVVYIKNDVIGSNRQKDAVIERGDLPRLLEFLKDEELVSSHEELLIEATATVNSLAKGTEEQVRSVIASGSVPILLSVLSNPNASERLIEITLRALRSIFSSSQEPAALIYEGAESPNCLIARLLELARPGQSYSNQECVATVFAKSCLHTENQNCLCNFQCVDAISALLVSPADKVQLAALDWLAQVIYQNHTVSNVVVTTPCNGKAIPDVLTQMLSQEKTPTMQLSAAKCMSYLYRSGSICSEDKRIVYKTLPTLIRLCKKDKEPQLRASSAEILAYLTEVDITLQQTASICDHIIPTLAHLLKPHASSLALARYRPDDDLSTIGGHMTPAAVRKLEQDVKVSQEMKQASFKAFASLGANDEDIRKRIIETNNLMEHIISGLSDSNLKIRLAALRCLHSLSRSVHQLKTTFQDHAVWVPLRNLLQNPSDEVLTVASSTLCNLLLEFSNSKQHFLDRTAMELLCNLTHRPEHALRLNGVWALMNMAYQAEQNVKMQILNTLGTEQIFTLLNDPDQDITIKSLGLLRNLLASKPHTDHIMMLHGSEIIEALSQLLEAPGHSSDVKEQAICILANIASGENSRDFIMKSETVLRRLVEFMQDPNVKLQSASVFCISNLAWAEEEGCQSRQQVFRELNIPEILKQLLGTSDTALFDKVKTALQQFD